MPAAVILFILAVWIIGCFKVIKEYERGVVFRLGRGQPAPR